MRQVVALSIAVLCVAANMVWGSAISTLLTVAIAAAVLYYLLQLRIEKYINTMHKAGQSIEADLAIVRAKQKYNTIAAVGLLAIVFASACIVVKRTVNPTKAHAWFSNIDHHSIAHTATLFSKSTSLIVPDEDAASGLINFSITGAQGQVQCENVYEPIFKLLDAGKGNRIQKPINNIFGKGFSKTFTLRNSANTITVHLPQAEEQVYRISVSSKDATIVGALNLPLGQTYELQVSASRIKQGMRLYNLLLANKTENTSAAQAYTLLEHLLRTMPDVLLLNAGDAAVQQFYIFPDRPCVALGYTLLADGVMCRPQTSIVGSVDIEQPFYMGLGNSGRQMYLKGHSGSGSLVYDYPAHYSLQGASPSNEPSKHRRFMTHSFSKVINNTLDEGYYFHNYNLLSTAQSSALADYANGSTNQAVRVSITDVLAQKEYMLTTKKPVVLSTNDAGVQHVLSLVDRSEHGFAYNKILQYLCILFLCICILLILAPGKALERVEPVVWVSIFCLYVVRCILSWRIATFPPEEGISKYELENTLIGFDFHFKQLTFPLPLSLLFIVTIIALLFIYRSIGAVRQWFGNLLSRVKALSQYHLLPVYFAGSLGMLLLLHFVSSQEVLRRLVDVLLPLCLYLFFSHKRNQLHEPRHVVLQKDLPQWRNRLKASVYYLVSNPTFIITVIACAYFAVTDRGFCVLFLLFILLKNIIVNFLKRSYTKHDDSVWRMLLRGRNYWMYAVLALCAYLAVLGVRPLFYYLLYYKLAVLCSVSVLVALAMYIVLPQQRKQWQIMACGALLLCTLCVLPVSRRVIDNVITNQIRHVQYRASIITQPIAQMLEQNDYSGFNTKKIIETAENQWFINSYISKPYDNSKIVNLRAFTKVGVNFSTQTRDVVVARFIIGELGNFVMVLLLLIVALPMLVYLLSYKLVDAGSTEDNTLPRFHMSTYMGLLPLLIVFTIALFVWLTSTNRFVFFGQDFPFLSITSRIAVLLPMLLYGITLAQVPQPFYANKVNVGVGLLRYLLLLGAAVGVVLITGRKNELTSDSFNATVPSAEQFIDTQLNSILYRIQQAARAKGKALNYAQLIAELQADQQYKAAKAGATSPYMASILQQLERNPAIATKVNSPLHIVYDRGMYEALYNKTLYLQMPVVENKLQWNGSIYEQALGTSSEVNIKIDGVYITVQAPYRYISNNGALQLAVMPSSWLHNTTDAIGVLSLSRDAKKTATVVVYSARDKTMRQTAATTALALYLGDVAYVQEGKAHYEISIASSRKIYACNKYINGEYTTLYPMQKNNFWMYHFANAVKSAYSSDSLMLGNVQLNMDYTLHESVHQAIYTTYGDARIQNNKFRFSVIAADGNGRVVLMDDIVRNRKVLDPNDAYAIYKLQQKHFFYSNTQNERDQWGNSNLTHMYLGPGSSIKPVVGAAMVSMVNAGWQNLTLNADMGAQVNNYAGLKLAIPWRNVDGEVGLYNYARYLEKSSNYYHSSLMFLGSYTKQAFADTAGDYNLTNILTTNAGPNNDVPKLLFNGSAYYLPNYRAGKGNWPRTTADAKSFFANNNSILAQGLELNANLATKSKSRSLQQAQERANFTDSAFYARLSASKSSSFLWSFPELSTFLQQAREFSAGKKKNEIHQNFLMGLQTPTLGGSPYSISAHKLLEMYTSLFTQNRDYRAHILPQRLPYTPWYVDSSWQYTAYKNFLAQNIFTGMRNAVKSGTATALAGVATGYYVYAKTGTINDGDARSSRRLVVVITDKDVTQVDNIGASTKVYTLYFMTDGTGDFNWALLRDIISKATTSNSFKQYFKS